MQQNRDTHQKLVPVLKHYAPSALSAGRRPLVTSRTDPTVRGHYAWTRWELLSAHTLFGRGYAEPFKFIQIEV
jgi:hypothetical protein